MRTRQPLRRRRVRTVLVVLVAAVLGATAVPSAMAGADFEWVLTGPAELNPGKAELPANATGGAASASHIDWGTTVVPQAEFDIDFSITAAGESGSPPPRLKPGTELTITATATGQLTGEKTQQGFRWSDVILLVNDRWPGGAITSAAVNCVDPIGAPPISCMESDGPNTDSVTTTAPTFGDTYSIGVGVLNCGPCYVRFTYEAKETKPPPPPPTPPKVKGLSIDYSMPDRFWKRAPNGLIRYRTKKKAIAPKKWRVDFVVKRKDGKPCRPSDVLVVKVPKSKASLRPKGRNRCRFYGLFPKEGKYKIKVSLKTRNGVRYRGSRAIVVQDWLIFGLGDSNGSGEGAPDVPNRGRGELKWQEKNCHRSANSYQALSARGIERNDRRTSVTFVHLACSGAAIDFGLLNPYRGIEPGKLFRPQIKAMKTLAQKREIDAVIVSIGVNDLGFGALVGHCIELPNCQNQPFPEATSAKTLDEVMRERLASLINVNNFGDNSGLYDRVARALKQAKIPPQRVFITEYFDSTQDENGYCDPLIEVFLPDIAIGEGLFDRAEAQWASQSVLGPLNGAVLAAAEKHGWRLVFGSQEGYRTHGYCSSDPWIVGLAESLWNQTNKEGTLHSTTRGNVFQAQLVVKEMRKFLYKNGRARVPVN